MCYNLNMNLLEAFAQLVIFFTVFSVVGYFIEVIFCSIQQRKMTNRGFLFGPCLPIYGFGGTLMALTLSRYSDDPFVVFGMAILICTVLEYFTSYIMEKMFKARWWDYSLTDKFNLNGRICLRNTLAFGIGGCIMIYFALPVLENLLKITPFAVQLIISIILVVILLIDTIISTYANLRVSNMADFNEILGDQTEEIKKYAKLVIKQFFATSEKEKRAAARELKKQQRKIDRRGKKLSKMLGNNEPSQGKQ